MTRQIPFGDFSFSVSFCMAHILVTASPHDNQTLNSNRWIDLNSDLGEHDGDGYAADRAMLGVVSSANIACGAHAGSPDVMRQTIRTARSLGVGIGAHPGYPDREGFGRRELSIGIDAIMNSLIVQLELMKECCAEEGATLSHVKPHGAMYNRAVHDTEFAERLADGIVQFDAQLTVMALAGSELQRAAQLRGLKVAREAFIDRGYSPDGTLAPRSVEGSVIEDPRAAAARALEIALHGTIRAMDGRALTVAADSLCVHSDSRNAVESMTLCRAELFKAGFSIRPLAT